MQKINLENVVMIEKEVSFSSGRLENIVDEKIHFVLVFDKSTTEFENGDIITLAKYLHNNENTYMCTSKVNYYNSHTLTHIDEEEVKPLEIWMYTLKDNPRLKEFLTHVDANNFVELKYVQDLEKNINNDMINKNNNKIKILQNKDMEI